MYVSYYRANWENWTQKMHAIFFSSEMLVKVILITYIPMKVDLKVNCNDKSLMNMIN